MSKRKRIILLITAIIIELIIFVILLLNSLTIYLLFISTLLVITTFYLIYYCWTTRNDDAIFRSSLNDILKNYNSVLVKIISLPDFTDKNIVRVADLDDLIVAQMEIRKPISYFEELDSCTFILQDNQDSYIYVLKKNNLVKPIIQSYLDNNKLKESKTYSNLLSDIDKTTIIKLENSKSYRISPIRKSKDKETEILSLDSEII